MAKNKKNKKKKKGLFGLFGGGKGEEPATPPGDALPEHDMTMMPGYAQGEEPDAAEMTMAPGYVQHFRPESSGETGAISFGSQTPGSLNLSSPGDDDNFVPGEMTMAPGYAADLGNQSDFADPRPGGPDPFSDPPPGGGPDPFGAALSPGAGADPFGDPTAAAGAPDPFGDPTAAAGAPDPFGDPTAAAGAPDPFGDPLGAAGAPDPFGDPLGAAGAPDPFGDPLGAAGAPDPFGDPTPAGAPDPFGDPLGAATPSSSGHAHGVDPTAETFAVPGSGAAPDFGGMNPAEMTMVPGYAGGGLGTRDDWAKPPAGPPEDPAVEMTMAPGYAGGASPAADPFGGAEMTMAPGYATGASPAEPQDPFGADLGGLGAVPPAGAADPFGADLGAGEMTMAPSYSAGSGGPTDPFGGPDPFGGDLSGSAASPSAAEAAALGTGADPNDPFGPALLDQPSDPLASASEFAERTMVDMPSDISDLEVLRPTTEELQIDDLGFDDPAGLGGVRDLFASFRQVDGYAVASGLDEAVSHDIARGLIFAAPVEGGWRVLPGLRRLSDGTLLGAVQVDEAGEFKWALPSETEVRDGVLRVQLPSSAQHDPQTRALRIPRDEVAQLAWRPARFWRDDEGGLCCVLPAEVTLSDGYLEIPQEEEAPTTTSELDPSSPHGDLVFERTYLGVTERNYADGWSSLELGHGAELTSDGFEVDLKAPGTRPALLEVIELPCGVRGRIALPSLVRQEAGLIWLPPIGSEEPAPEPGLFEPESSVRESRLYLGIRDELLESGWVRLVLPPNASVSGGVLRVPEASDEPASLRGAFDLDESGALSFTLPEGSEVLGDVVLIPPAGDDLVTDTWASPGQAPFADADPGPRRWSARESGGRSVLTSAGTQSVKTKDATPAVEEPAVEEPAVEEPVVEEPVVEEPVVEEPVVEEPVVEEPVVEEPAVEEPVVEESAVEEPAVEEPAVEEPAVEEPVVEESAVEESSASTSKRKKKKLSALARFRTSKSEGDDAPAGALEEEVSAEESTVTEPDQPLAEVPADDEVPADEKATDDEVPADEEAADEKPKRKPRRKRTRKKKTE